MQQFSETAVYGGEDNESHRPLMQAARRGFAKKCPACGKGELFEGFLKVRPVCESCGEELHHHRADDRRAEPATIQRLRTQAQKERPNSEGGDKERRGIGKTAVHFNP